MQLTILGSAGTHPAAGRACSGYLVDAEGTRVMVDAGNGSSGNLQHLAELRQLDAIVLSHRHIDHCIDLIGMFYALLDSVDDHPPIPVHAAPDVLAFLTGLLSKDSTLSFERVFDAKTIDAGEHLDVGPLSFDFLPSIHPVPTLSMRIRHDNGLLVYSSDSAGGDELVTAARDADVLLCEATWDSLEGRPPGIHLDGAEAGRLAKLAGARRLLLTHVAAGSDRAVIQEEAVEAFGSDDVIQVDDLLSFDV